MGGEDQYFEAEPGSQVDLSELFLNSGQQLIDWNRALTKISTGQESKGIVRVQFSKLRGDVAGAIRRLRSAVERNLVDAIILVSSVEEREKLLKEHSNDIQPNGGIKITIEN